MDSIKKDTKLPYEPPRIYELEVDMTQAMGASKCSTGSSATGSTCRIGRSYSPSASCTSGNKASGSGPRSCQSGNRAR